MTLHMDMSDAALIEDCAEVDDFLASYKAGCQLVADAESAQAGDLVVEQACCRLRGNGRLWRALLRRATHQQAHTFAGLVAKAHASRNLLELCSPEPTEATEFLASVVSDLLRLLSSEAGIRS